MSPSEHTLTDNKAIAYASTDSHIVDYFMMLTRTLAPEANKEHLEKCWKEDPRKTLATVFNSRDRLNGKKEKLISNTAMMWLKSNKPETYKKNILNYINKYGCWKDLLYIAYNMQDNHYELNLFAEQLNADLQKLQDDSSVSLCAKWAPSEGDRNDKRKQLAKKIANILYSRTDKKKMEKYRKIYLTPLRNKINIVETLMCSNKWNTIKYDCVPGVASKKYLEAFMKHDKERYDAFLAEVRSGTKEIKTTGILPHELIKYYIDNRAYNETIELQWKAIVEKIKESGTLSSMLPVIDVSGSMFSASNGSIPAQVAIALGILTSLCCQGQYNRKLISFSEKPVLISLKGESLFDCFNEIMNIPQGLNTNFIECSRLIINFGKMFDVPDDKMPKKLVVFTDMQFDQASQGLGDMKTTYEYIKELYTSNSYSVPKFIFWNVNSDSNNTFPVKNNNDGTAIISGFSEQLLKVFMNYDDFDASLIVEEILKPYLQDVIIDVNEL